MLTNRMEDSQLGDTGGSCGSASQRLISRGYEGEYNSQNLRPVRLTGTQHTSQSRLLLSSSW